jgi:hypothetical protein
MHNHSELNAQKTLEQIFERKFYEQKYDEWVKNFALNLNNIWNELSARVLDPEKDPLYHASEHSAIVIGAGPSLKKHNHLNLLANSKYEGTIICTDRSLIPALEADVTPDRFPKFYVVTIDPLEILKKFYDNKIVDKYGAKINGIFSTVIHPLVVERARKLGIKVHWLHALFDYAEGKKSFNQMSALMVRAKNHVNGLPAIQTGGNVGTSCWFIGWKILKCSVIGLVGINHGYDQDDSLESITTHYKVPNNIDRNSELFKKLFPTIYNPEFRSYCILDPTFQYYSNALKEFISRSPKWITTINATEGGCIFGERIQCHTFEKFLKLHKK